MRSQVSDLVEKRPGPDDLPGPGASLDILVVDDEPSILELVKVALENLEPYRVSTASGAGRAMAMLEDEGNRFDCLLLDIQMPEENGIQLLRRLRQLPRYAETPVIMLTAMSERHYIDDAFIEGATDYVSKPFDFFELRGRIRCAHRLIEARNGTPPPVDPAPRGTDGVQPDDTPSPPPVEPVHRDGRIAMFRSARPEAVAVEGITRILRDVEFDNYLDQLARQKLLKSQAVAVGLGDADSYLRDHGKEALREALHRLAAGIQFATRDMDRVFSYRARGVFIIIVHGRRTGGSLSSLHNLDEVIDARLDKYLLDAPFEAQVGRPVQMAALSRTRAARAIDEAIEAVRTEAGRPASHTDPRPRMRTAKPHRPVTRSEERLYERVLHELYGKASYLRAR